MTFFFVCALALISRCSVSPAQSLPQSLGLPLEIREVEGEMWEQDEGGGYKSQCTSRLFFFPEILRYVRQVKHEEKIFGISSFEIP